MGSPIADIPATRDAICTLLNASMSGWTPTPPAVTAVGVYDIKFSLEELDGGRLVVMPTKKKTKLLARGTGTTNANSDPKPIASDMWFDVGVQFRYKAPTPAIIDPWMTLIEQITKFFPSVKLSNGAVCLESEHAILFEQEHMRDWRVFTSVATVMFRLE